MPTEAINELTRLDWRQLGFYYSFEKNDSCWYLTGSREGLLKFPALLIAFAEDPRNAAISEHDHYGPYMYLKLVTWDAPHITNDAIYGTLSDLTRLAKILDRGIRDAIAGDKFVVDEEFAPGCDAKIEIEIRPDGFDPASADPELTVGT